MTRRWVCPLSRLTFDRAASVGGGGGGRIGRDISRESSCPRKVPPFRSKESRPRQDAGPAERWEEDLEGEDRGKERREDPMFGSSCAEL